MASVRRKDDGRIRDGTGLWLQLSVEKFIEALVGGGVLGELARIKLVEVDEGSDAPCGIGSAHPGAIPLGEARALD